MGINARRVAGVFARSWLFSILFTLVLLAPGWSAADDGEGFRRPFDRIVVFGTSLSDPGNAFALTGTHLSPPDFGMDAVSDPLSLRIPDFPYARGGNHFSNGATWIEQLGRRMGAARSVRPAFVESRGGSSNYAVGGTRARDGVAGEVSLSMQVRAFLRDAGRNVPSDALYVIEMGGNDIRDAVEAAAGVIARGGTLEAGIAAGSAVIADAIGSIMGQIGSLHALGAGRFLVWGAPDLSLTPAVNRLNLFRPGAKLLAAAFSAAFDNNLRIALSGLPTGLVVRFDVFNLLHRIVLAPGDFGLKDVRTTCITPSVPPFQCRHPDRFLFWDGIHPTTAAHRIIAREAARALEEALEMATEDD